MAEEQKHILVIEDEKPMAHALETKLSSEAFSVTSVTDGEQALAKLREESYDVILLDIVIPGVNGFTILETIRNEEGPNTYANIIVLSNLSQEEDKDKAMERGADAYFVKSDISISALVDEVKAQLNTSEDDAST